MSDQITTSFIQQFAAAVVPLAQQGESRLRGTIREEDGRGEKSFVEQLGTAVMTQITSRHADTAYANTPHDRRMVVMLPFAVSDIVDIGDRVRTLVDPTNPYTENFRRAASRKIDQIIINALTGTSFSDKTGSTSNTLGSANTVVVDYIKGTPTGDGTARNLTVGKVKRAAMILNQFEVPDEDRFFAVSASALDALMDDPLVSSRDFNTMQPLTTGTMDNTMWMGFRWRRLELLAIDSNNVRDCIAFQKTGGMLKIGEEVNARVDILPTKNYSTQAYLRMDMGAARLEEEKVVLVKADEDE